MPKGMMPLGLLNAIPNGKYLPVKAAKDQFQISSDNLRLREAVMSCIYTAHYNIEDVVQLVTDHVSYRGPQNQSIGGLWSLAHSLPLDSLPELFDRLSKIELDEGKGSREALRFFDEVLTRTLFSIDIEANRLWLWFSKLKSSTSYSSYRKDIIKDWLSANQ